MKKNKIFLCVGIGIILLNSVFYFLYSKNHWGEKTTQTNIMIIKGDTLFNGNSTVQFSISQNGYYAIGNNNDVFLWAKTNNVPVVHYKGEFESGNKAFVNNTDIFSNIEYIKKNQKVTIEPFQISSNESLVIVLNNYGNISFIINNIYLYILMVYALGLFFIILYLFLIFVKSSSKSKEHIELNKNKSRDKYALENITGSIPVIKNKKDKYIPKH